MSGARLGTCPRKRAVKKFGWAFFLIPLGGQAPHVTLRPMGVHRTCGGADEAELTPIGVRSNGSVGVPVLGSGIEVQPSRSSTPA